MDCGTCMTSIFVEFPQSVNIEDIHFRMLLKEVLLVSILCCLWYQTVRSQQVNVTIFTESKCKYCTKLLREQIWPFYVKRPGIMNIQVKLEFSFFFLNLQETFSKTSILCAFYMTILIHTTSGIYR